MRKITFLMLSIFFFSIQAHSHYQWIVSQPDIPGEGNSVKFVIGCGHRFPESELLLRREMISGVFFIDSGIKKPLNIHKEKKSWAGNTKVPGDSVCLIEFRLKKKLSKNPFFWGRSVIFQGKHLQKEFNLITGNGMEIIPEDLHLKRRSDYLSLRTFVDGKPVPAKLTLIPEGKKASYLHPDNEGKCKIKLRYSGRYLISTFYKGKGASITFNVKETRKSH